MKRLLIILAVIFMSTQACSIQADLAGSNKQEEVPSTVMVPPTEAPVILPTIMDIPTEIPATATTAPTATMMPTTIPSDITFSIDCSDVDETRKGDCDTYITRTRDMAYPVLRQITGASLGACYTDLHYVILSKDPAEGAGGLSGGDTITYNQKYSLDLVTQMDVHEVLHSISTCNKALDLHVFHIMIQNAAYETMGIKKAGYYVSRDAGDLNENLEFLLESLKTAKSSEVRGLCTGILYRKMGIAYFDLGKEAIPTLYQSTFAPVELENPPSEILKTVWGSQADQVQALLETLQREYQYKLDVPTCGL